MFNLMSDYNKQQTHINQPGLRRPLSLSSAETFPIGVSHFIRQQEPLCSSGHSYFKLLFVGEGKGSYQIGHRKIPAQSGDLFLIAPGEVNDFSGLATTWNWIVIFEADTIVPCLTDTDIFGLLPHEFLLLSFLQIKNGEIRCFNIAPVDIPRWLTRLQQIEREIHHKPTSLTKTARTLLIQLLIDTVRLIAPQLSKNPLHSHPLLSSVFDFIQQNYNRQISLCDVAKAVERSSAYLTDLVRRKTGRTVLNWIIEYRMAAARRLLLRTTCSVESISQDLGYLDKSHFLRQFRRRHGTTPKAWRSAYRE